MFLTDQIVAEEVPLRYLWNRKWWRMMSVDLIQAHTSTTSTQIESN